MSVNGKEKAINEALKGLTSPPTVHETLTSGTQRLFTATEGYPRCFWIKDGGSLVIKDSNGTSATYPVLASQPFVFENCTEIEATTDTDVIIQW